VPAEIKDGHYTVTWIDAGTFSLDNTFNAGGGGGNLDWRKDIKITLPAAASHDDNIYTVMKVDANEGAVDVFDNDGTKHYYLLETNAYVTLKSDGTNWILVNTLPVEQRIGSSKNLLILTSAVETAEITADEVVLRDTNNISLLVKDVKLTVDLSTGGVNALDTGSEAVSTWYYLWVISNGSTTAGLISVSATAPTMPSGYTYKALVGAMKNDGGGDLIEAYQQGNRLQYGALQNVINVDTPSTTWTDADCAAFVPPISRQVTISLWSAYSNAQVNLMLRVNGSSSTGLHTSRTNVDGTLDTSISDQHTDSAQIFEYRFDGAATNTVTINVHGYLLAL
jgi:hypothetical protein